MTRTRRWLRRILLAAAALALVWFGVPALIGSDLVARRICAALLADTAYHLRYESLELGWRSGLELEAAELADRGNDQVLALAQVPRLEARVALGSLLRGRPRVTCRVERPLLRLRRPPAGAPAPGTAPPGPGGAPPAPGPPPQRSFAPPAWLDLTVEDARVELEDAARTHALGTVELRAMPADPAGLWSADLALELDNSALTAALAGLLPAPLRLEQQTVLELSLRVPTDPPPVPLRAHLLRAQLAARLRCGFVGWSANRLWGLKVALDGKDGRLEWQASAAQLNGGPLSLGGALSAAGAGHASVHLAWQDGKASASLVPALRYLVPLVAGVPGTDELDFQSAVDLEVEVAGPLAQLREAPLQVLSQWYGRGEVTLRNGTVRPAEPIRKLLLGFEREAQFEFVRFHSAFELKDGEVLGPDIRVGHDERLLALSGKTGLDGTLDYAVDLTSFLEGHRTGEKVRELLGEPVTAHLRGTLEHPRVDVRDDVRRLLEDLSGSLLEDLREDPEGTVERLRDLLRKKKDRDG